MKIEITTKPNTVPATDIPVGSCFEYGSQLCLRTNGSYSGPSLTGFPCRMVSLNDGHENGLDSSIMVVPRPDVKVVSA